MSLNRVKDLLRAGKPAFGAIVTMPSAQVAQVMARAGFDLLLIDMEHGPIDLPSAHAMIAATGGTNAVPMARIAANAPSLAKPLLDAGALGICVPMVCTRAEAETAARAIRYPPTGERMWGPFYAPLRWNMTMPEYMHAANEAVLSLITIEHPDAVANIDEIVHSKGVDVAIIGPGDMATSLGHYGQADHPAVRDAIQRAQTAILGSDIVLGGVASSPDHANRMTAMGYRMIFLGFDWSLLLSGASHALTGIIPNKVTPMNPNPVTSCNGAIGSRCHAGRCERAGLLELGLFLGQCAHVCGPCVLALADGPGQFASACAG